MVNDSISDVLTRIRNSSLVKSKTVSLPLSRINEQLCNILEKEGFISSFQKKKKYLIVLLKYNKDSNNSIITNLRRISKPGLRIYANKKEIPKILGGLGIIIISTSQGIMTDREARFRKIGGEILCAIW